LAAEKALAYFELEDGHCLDVAAVDGDGDVVVCGEVERLNHDYRDVVLVDYDKMSAGEPEAAIWVVMTQRDGHKLVDALREANEGEPRVQKEYGHKTPPRQFRIDEPGFTEAYSLKYVRDTLLAEDQIGEPTSSARVTTTNRGNWREYARRDVTMSYTFRNHTRVHHHANRRQFPLRRDR